MRVRWARLYWSVCAGFALMLAAVTSIPEHRVWGACAAVGYGAAALLTGRAPRPWNRAGAIAAVVGAVVAPLAEALPGPGTPPPGEHGQPDDLPAVGGFSSPSGAPCAGPALRPVSAAAVTTVATSVPTSVLLDLDMVGPPVRTAAHGRGVVI